MREKEEEGKTGQFVVGVGASAGGLEALEEFFRYMPSDSNLSFVVIQHLSPNHKSLMEELLSKHTEIKVKQTEDGETIKKNHIYLIPPKHNMTVGDGKLHLLEHEEGTHGLNLPIDIFFESLAKEQKDKAIGVVLSGTGSDGTRGVRGIKEAGGMVMVQDENSAKFDGMPRSAISTRLVDYVLPAEEMAERLLNYVQHPHVAHMEGGDGIVVDENHLARIAALVRNQTGLDLTFYKPNTIIRRIERRMSVNQFNHLIDYVDYLSGSPQEVDALFKEF